MSWLFARQLRPFVLLAGAASLVLNLALLVPALYMLQVFDRVFASRSVETLVMLSLFALLALGLGYCMDTVARHARWPGPAARSTGACRRPRSQACCATPRAPRAGRRRRAARHRAAARASSPAAACRRCSTRPGCRSTCS